MLLLKAFVSKSCPVNGTATCAVAIGHVSTLNHEAWHNAVERTTTEVQATRILAGAQLSEVFNGARHNVREQLELHARFGFHCTKLCIAFRLLLPYLHLQEYTQARAKRYAPLACTGP